jgi:3-hydroxybutyrate dehydrogenase
MANGFGDAGAIAARVAEIQRLGLRAARHTADSRDPMQIAGMIEDTANAHGSPGSLVNNAVVRYFGTEDNFAPEHGDEAIAVNLPATKAKGRAGSSAWPRSTAISRR